MRPPLLLPPSLCVPPQKADPSPPPRSPTCSRWLPQEWPYRVSGPAEPGGKSEPSNLQEKCTHATRSENRGPLGARFGAGRWPCCSLPPPALSLGAQTKALLRFSFQYQLCCWHIPFCESIPLQPGMCDRGGGGVTLGGHSLV